MGARINRLSSDMLLNVLAEIERELNAFKEAQIIGRSNTQVKTSKTDNAVDASFSVAAFGTKVVLITFTPTVQKNAFLDLITEVYVNGVLQKNGFDYYHSDYDSAGSQGIRKARLFVEALASPINVTVKCYVNSVDSGSISVAVL